MIQYSELKKGDRFNVVMHSIKPLSDDKELNYKYSLRFYQEGKRKNVEFIKDSNISCHDSVTNTSFRLDGGKMISDDTGLYFFGGYVDDSRGSYVDPKTICEYFKEAALSKQSSRTHKM